MKAETARFDYSKELQIENKKSVVKEKKKVQYNETELKEILARHKHWLDEDCEGWEGMRADFWGADLSYANLVGADLRRINFSGADLRRADLRCADLGGANFIGADLSEAGLRGAKNVPFVPMACPDTGAFVGWKKANGCIIKLLIPEDAKRSSATGRKCRCDKAIVLSITDRQGRIHDKPGKGLYATSDYDNNFRYRVGEAVSVDYFCEDRFAECAPGIHFFINKQEAIDYV